MVIEIQGSVVLLSGALGSNHWPAIRAATYLALQGHPQGVVIDCGELNYITGAGVQTFVEALQYIETTDLPILIARLPESITGELGGTTARGLHHDTTASTYAARIARAIHSNLWWERLWG